MRLFLIISFFLLGKSSSTQNKIADLLNADVVKSNSDTFLLRHYDNAFKKISSLLQSNGTFKDAVFTVENAYFVGRLDSVKFSRYIYQLKELCEQWSMFNRIGGYRFSDSANFQKNFALFKIMKDTVTIIDTFLNKYYHLPYTYEFNDFAGRENWTNMFVSKLLITHKGNCHNLPYLYKILADEIGATCWLALAPNHIYIANRCIKSGWYNTELTSGDFPIDAWIMASGYLPLKAIQSGIYMDTLSNQKAIALCVLDLAKGYEHKTGNYYNGFVLKCCDLSLQYFPLNVQALLLKAETLKHIYQSEIKQKGTAAKATYQQMEELYVRLFDLGYREMPDSMYFQWLQSVIKERDKYSNKQIKEVIKPNR
jgi:hypothetical protein